MATLHAFANPARFLKIAKPLTPALFCAGVALILTGQAQAKMGEEAFVGALAILGSAVCYSYNIILMRQQAQVADPAEISFFQSLTVGSQLLLAAPWLLGVDGVTEAVIKPLTRNHNDKNQI